MHQSFISLALLIATTLVAGFFAYIHSMQRQTYLLLWTAGWAVFALHYVGPTLARNSAASPLQSALNHWLFALSGVLFFLGAQLYSQRKSWKFPALVVCIVFGFWAASNATSAVSVSVVIPASLLYTGVAVVFWQESRRQETLADRLLGVSFASWGVLWIALHILNATPELQGPGMNVVATAPGAFVAAVMVMALYEEEKRRVERNMLALSNLNLATSSFVGGEIQRMLSQALDRVLGVVRLPAGALFLHHGDPQGPTSVVAVGLSDDFCRAAQTEGLDDYLVRLVARIGGLMAFRDLRDDALAALDEKEEPIRRFRQLALTQGLRSVVGISLQAKEQVFGVLLLGSPDARRFTPAELRLLLALGHQIGMAVENSLLIQQTSRRSEELHVLNEIGRALSSTLHKEDLLRKIWEELRRLFDVENFYIATLDTVRDEMHFDLEIIDGARIPRRARPAGNFLTEYVIRTRQPVLIRDNFVEETRKLGVEPLRGQGCFCCVPLVAYDRAIGAMAVFSDQDKAFDEG